MIATPRRVVSTLAICLLAFSMPAFAMSCLIFPLSCLKPKKKYGDEMEAVVLDLRKTRTDAYDVNIYTGATTANPVQNTRTWYIWFKVGQTLYQGERNETILQMWYTPPREEWIGKPHSIRFLDKKWLGMKGAEVVFKKENGKEWDFAVDSIIGPDGIDECKGRIFCPQQAGVDREAREQEQLAKLAKTGAKSASDVAPAPIEEPEAAVVAATPEVAAQPAIGAAPAEMPAPADAASPPADGAPSESSAPVTEAAPAVGSTPATEATLPTETVPTTEAAPQEPPAQATAPPGTGTTASA